MAGFTQRASRFLSHENTGRYCLSLASLASKSSPGVMGVSQRHGTVGASSSRDHDRGRGRGHDHDRGHDDDHDRGR